MNNYHKFKENHKLNLNVQEILHLLKVDLQQVSQLFHNINLILTRHNQRLSQILLFMDLLIIQHLLANLQTIRPHTLLRLYL